jgi:hopanoid biosynthesis associated protein HpnK
VNTQAGKQLVVTADDFGLSLEVNDAVERAHCEGILTAASLMVCAPATTDAVMRAHRMRRLRVGLHVVLVEGSCALPPERLPALVDAHGRFRADMACYGASIFFSPRGRRQLAEEIAAQFEAFRATELALDHIDAHRHFHLHPTIAGAIIKQARRHGSPFVRAPREPARVLAAVEMKSPRGLETILVAPFARMLAARLRRAGLRTPDQVFGLAWSGAMTRARLLGLLAHLPNGLSEIYTHPATRGGFSGAAADYHYDEELAALTAPEVAEAAAKSGARLGGFADFR